MRHILTIVIIGLLLYPPPAECWWAEGHQVVARIAGAHLSPGAVLRVAELLEVENTPEAVAEGLAAAASWADEVKGETETGHWHYINLAWQDSRADMASRCPNDDCVSARVRLFAAQLKANEPDTDSRFSDKDALRFLVHFVGDLHQPLHAFSDADKGGNCEILAAAVDDAKTLHGLWDGPLVSRMGEDEAALAGELNAEIGNMTDEQRADFSSGEADDWAWEAHRLALVHVYKRLAIPKEDVVFPAACSQAPEDIQQLHVEIDEKYLEEMQPVVREQLKKAGLRLAKMLNEI